MARGRRAGRPRAGNPGQWPDASRRRPPEHSSARTALPAGCGCREPWRRKERRQGRARGANGPSAVGGPQCPPTNSAATGAPLAAQRPVGDHYNRMGNAHEKTSALAAPMKPFGRERRARRQSRERVLFASRTRRTYKEGGGVIEGDDHRAGRGSGHGVGERRTCGPATSFFCRARPAARRTACASPCTSTWRRQASEHQPGAKQRSRVQH